MKKTLVAIFFVTLFAMQAFGQQVQKKEVYMYPNEVMLELLLTKWDIDYVRVKPDKYIVHLDGNKTNIDIYNDDIKSLLAQRSFKAKLSLAKLNDFNKTNFWGRAHIDNDTVVISSELIFNGGISEDVIEAFLTLFDVVAEEAEKELK